MKVEKYVKQLKAMMDEDYEAFIMALSSAIESEQLTHEEYEEWLNSDEPVLCYSLSKEEP